MNEEKFKEMGFEKDPEKMTRKERREWYRQHRKELKLPRWSELRQLQREGKTKQYE